MRALVARDQETHTVTHQARSEASSIHVRPIVISLGDGNFETHVRDAIFRRSKGFRILELARVLDVYDHTILSSLQS